MYVYEIRIQGHPDQHWFVWFDGLTITNESDGSTRLASPLVDEVALHGVLIKVRDLALPLLALSRVVAHGAERKRYDTWSGMQREWARAVVPCHETLRETIQKRWVPYTASVG